MELGLMLPRRSNAISPDCATGCKLQAAAIVNRLTENLFASFSVDAFDRVQSAQAAFDAAGARERNLLREKAAPLFEIAHLASEQAEQQANDDAAEAARSFDGKPRQQTGILLALESYDRAETHALALHGIDTAAAISATVWLELYSVLKALEPKHRN
jgi:hypothetical protein